MKRLSPRRRTNSAAAFAARILPPRRAWSRLHRSRTLKFQTVQINQRTRGGRTGRVHLALLAVRSFTSPQCRRMYLYSDLTIYPKIVLTTNMYNKQIHAMLRGCNTLPNVESPARTYWVVVSTERYGRYFWTESLAAVGHAAEPAPSRAPVETQASM